MNKYDVRFCSCGRVHFIENQKVEPILESGKSVLHICNNCGKVTGIWWENNGDDTFSICSENIKDREISNTDNIGLIITSLGERIIMKTGEEATGFFNGDFRDYENMTELDDNYKIVDTQKTINWIKDKEKLECMSHYAVDIHWIGTEFETEYNK